MFGSKKKETPPPKMTDWAHFDYDLYQQAQNAPPEPPAEPRISCPRCGSTQLHADKRGFSAGKAVTGALLVGPTGLVAGAIGQNKLVVTCLSCGHRWKF